MSYDPQPLDTSKFDPRLPSELVEELAEHVHDVWGAARKAEGWTYGEQRDDTARLSPDMVPYATLPSGEKDFDRRSGLESLKFLMARGYHLCAPRFFVSAPKIRPPAPGGDDPPNDGEEPPNDMNDKGELDRPGCDDFRAVLKKLGEVVYPVYKAADSPAKDFQKKYLAFSLGSIYCGLLAVLIAIWQLTPLAKPAWWLTTLEFVLAALAVTAVVIVLHKQYHDGWLTHRNKAERLRALKHGALLDSELWGPGRTEYLIRLAARMQKIERMQTDELPCVLTEAGLDPTPPLLLTGNAALHECIAEYYLNVRLLTQERYCIETFEKRHRSNRRLKIPLLVLFFGVLGVVFAHAVDTWVHLASSGHVIAYPDMLRPLWRLPYVLLYAAAAIPVFNAALHTYRSGREFGRNALRLQTTAKRVSAIRTRLQLSTSAEEQIRLMVQAESVLASEHQQWLQLMKECEWFG